MKELIKELEESIYDCKIDAGDGGNNLDCVSDAIELLDKLKEAINYTDCCETLPCSYAEGYNDAIAKIKEEAKYIEKQ